MTRARLRTVFTVLAKRGVVRTGGMGQAGTAKGKKRRPVAPPATTIRGAGPPGAPAAAKQDDPATDVEYPRAVEDMKDFANNTGGNSGANDNAHHQRGGQIRRR